MLNFRKVVERGNGTANLNEDQANYEEKVGELEKACENFGNYLKTVKSGTPFPKIIEAFEDKNKGFRKQMEKLTLKSK